LAQDEHVPSHATDQLKEVDGLIRETQELINDLSEQLAPLLANQARAQERLRLLKELRSTFPAHPGVEDHQVSPPLQTGASSTRERVQTCVRQLLSETSDPLHTSDLHRLFLERGWPIPGAGRPGNISAHLTEAKGICSPRRGYWALGERKPASVAMSRRTKSKR
jgi:hypothetical protein